jgi:DNA polymerase III epsilon subunit-like protein
MSWLTSWWQPRHRPDEPLETVRQRGFVAIDLETTGLDPRRDRIVSAAALTFVDRDIVRSLVTLVNPGVPIPASATAIHGIDDAAVTDAPDEATVVARLDAVCGGQVVVGHGLAFDIAVIARARRHVAATPGPVMGRHTADGDALTAGHVLLALLPRLYTRGIRTLADTLWLQERGVLCL